MRYLKLQLLSGVLASVLVLGAQAARPTHPPVSWQPTHANFTASHRKPGDIRYIVIHTTEGSADGAASWFQNDKSHVSAHYVISRTGDIVQLVRQHNIAWHAGNWAVNTTSIGIEHEGVTDDPSGYTDPEYRASARLVAYICRTWDVAIDRNHIIGHAEVPDPNDPALRGGSDHHTDPGQYWNWPKYMKLVRFYAGKRTLVPRVRIGAVTVGHGHTLTGIVPWHARTTRGVRRVDFRIDGRLVRRDTRRPFVLPRLNTTSLRNGTHMLEVHAYGARGIDVWRKRLRVWNRPFVVTADGVAANEIVVGASITVRAGVAGTKAVNVALVVDGRVVAQRTKPPFVFRWNSRAAATGPHHLVLRARARDGRIARAVVDVVVAHDAGPHAQIVAESPSNGATVSGVVPWNVQIVGPVRRVEFFVDGERRHVATWLPFTFQWDTTKEAPGTHTLLVRGVRPDGSAATATITVTVATTTG
jgi:N-acetyl-anhydromuramyl-L-alanine amidase AmpD